MTKIVNVTGRDGATRDTNSIDLTRKRPIQTLKMLKSANTMSKVKKKLQLVFNCKTICGRGGNCISDNKQPERKENICKHFVKSIINVILS